HDNEQGKLRSKNTVVCIDVDGMRLCHLGDLGHILDAVQLNKLGKVDVLFIPVGGLWAIDAAEATKVVETVNPKVVIPMHYKNERCTFPIAPVTDFLKDKKNVTKIDGSEVEYKVGTLPPTTQIVVLKPAL
ncbi:MAG TPA: MBL fold metallo-hydrolase, partial [Dehalococcoidales bacterium]|nr:MBL fold metallo-hydrolase [Dehalococcoidales bacterium]